MSSHSYTYRVTVEGDDDLVNIALFGRNEWGDLEATRYIERLIQSFERLTMFPWSGRIAGSLGSGLRSVSISNHIIYYRVNESSEEIEIVRVLHARMDAGQHLNPS